MKRIFILLLLCCCGWVKAQTVIYSQNFNSGSASDWSLNTSDLSGTTSLSDNQWVINNVYLGGTISGITTVPNTPDEPSTVTGYPESYYLHLFSALGVSFGGPNNDNFDAGGTGQTYFAALNTPQSTVGYSNVYFSFYWVCQGDAACAGKVYYRTSAGGAWTQIMTPTATFYGSGTWQLDSVHLAAFDGQSFLEFGFQFIDGDASGNDPAFGVDQIMITGTSTTSGPTITSSPTNATTCSGGTATFNATATGATSYQWQRSTTGTGGTFVNITSGMDGGIYGSSYTTTTLVITGATTADNGYAYQMVASGGTSSATSTPALLTVNTVPVVGAISGSASVCVGGTITLADGTTGGVWTSGTPSVATIGATGIVSGLTAGSTIITYTVSNVCGTNTATFNLTVTTSATVDTISGPGIACVGSPVTLTDGTPGGVWTSTATSVATINAMGILTGVSTGLDVISYSYTSSCGTATATLTITIKPAPTAGTIKGDTAFCIGTPDTLTDSLTGGIWFILDSAVAKIGSASGIMTGLMNGNVVVTYTINGSCGMVSTTTNVDVKTTPHPIVYTLPGHTLAVEGTYATYQWEKAGTNVTGATNPTYVFTSSANYQVVVDSNGCYATSPAHTFNLSVSGLSYTENEYGIARDGSSVMITSFEPLQYDEAVSLSDLTGRKISMQVWSAGTTMMRIDVDGLPTGMYMLRLHAADGDRVFKFIK